MFCSYFFDDCSRLVIFLFSVSTNFKVLVYLCRPVARFQGVRGQNTLLGGRDFCFYYMLKTNFSRHNQIWRGHKKMGGQCPRMPP